MIDIRGTNEFHEHVDEEWCSILVKTGVYQSGTVPKHEPRATVDTVLDAVKWGMGRSRKAALREMEIFKDGVEVKGE